MKDRACELRVRRMLAFASTLSLMLVSCGGVNESDTPLFAASSSGSFAARGEITGFGSIVVNGIEIFTSGATIQVDGAGGAESDLRLGQVVEVQGTLDNGGVTATARSVRFDANVGGPVDTLDTLGKALVVLGQPVRITTTTVMGFGDVPIDLIDLAPGFFVVVSGFVDSKGAIVATRVERRFTPSQLVVSGAIDALDPVAMRFSMNALTVEYASAAITGTLDNGVCVSAQGDASTSGTLLATRVDAKPCGVAAATGDRGIIAGLVNRFVSATDFEVDRQRVTTSASTVFTAGGASAAPGDLGLDAQVRVEGTFDSSGRLQASKVDIVPASSSSMTGTVESLNARDGTLIILGSSVTVNASTRMQDASRAPVSRMRFGDLRTGDLLEVRGYPGASATSLIATRITRRDADR
ncbi:MAG TPA: DUF5666 domain-containing protein [Steroidobacteraceae bacterium]|nr:DUF5666 domain-containing protein [Steroidobacteraceae bacterium]